MRPKNAFIHLDKNSQYKHLICHQWSGIRRVQDKKISYLWATTLSIWLCRLFFWIWQACSINHLRERKSWTILDDSTIYFNTFEGDTILETKVVVPVIWSFSNFVSLSTFELPPLEADLPDFEVAAAWRKYWHNINNMIASPNSWEVSACCPQNSWLKIQFPIFLQIGTWA